MQKFVHFGDSASILRGLGSDISINSYPLKPVNVFFLNSSCESVKSTMTLKVSSSLQCILTWLLYTDTMKWTTASSQPQVYGHLQQRKKVLTGGCPPARVDSEAACAMLCFLHAWCRVYVLGTCDPIYKNGCLCLICQMDPALDPNGWEYVSSRRVLAQNF